MTPNPSLPADPHSLLVTWIPHSQVSSLYAAPACLARLQRCVEQLEAAGLGEARRMELECYLEAQTRVLNRHLDQLLHGAKPDGPLALDGLLEGIVAWFSAAGATPPVELRLPPGPLLVGAPVAGCWLALQLLLQRALASNAPDAAAAMVVLEAPTRAGWVGHVFAGNADWVIERQVEQLAGPQAALSSPVDGLALSLAGELFRAFGGRLHSAGRAAGGLHLEFSLPKHAGTRRWTMLRPRVLVIDDDPDMCSFLTNQLAQAGFDAQAAPDGCAGLELAQSGQPDLVLLDVCMLPLDGRVVLERLRDCCDAPVIFLSAIADKASVAESLWLGAADYVTKPFHIRELMARVRAILRRRRPQAVRPRYLDARRGFETRLGSVA